MSQGPILNNQQLVSEIVKLCRSEASGTVLIATGDNQQAKLVLVDGKIVYASLRRQSGVEVLHELAGITSGVMAFHSKLQLINQSQDLPDTEGLLSILQSGQDESRPEATAEMTSPSSSLPRLPELIDVLVEEATEYLGPMAGPLCQEYLSSIPESFTPAHLHKVLHRIERDINHPQRAEYFKAAVLKRLKLE